MTFFRSGFRIRRRRLLRRRKAYSRRPYRRIVSRPSLYRFGKRHTKNFLYPNLSLTTTGTSFYAWKASDISKGELLDQRQGDKVYSRGIFVRGCYTNDHATHSRYIRMAVLTLSGSISPADTTTWGDLFVDAAYAKTGPVGNSGDVVYRINNDEYKVLFDKFWRVGSAGEGQTEHGEWNFFIPTKKMVSYVYNSDNERHNPIWVVFWICEAEGVTATAPAVEFAFGLSHYYTDVEATRRQLRGGKRRAYSIRKGM